MGWGWRRNTKHKERTRNGVFFMFRDGGRGGGGGARRGGGMSVDTKKKNKKAGVQGTPCLLLSRAPLAPPGPPCVFRRVCCVFNASWPPHFVSSCCCQQGCLGGVLGPFWRSWGVVWCVLALTRWVGDGSVGGSGVG